MKTKKKWYGLRRGAGHQWDILLVLPSYDEPPTKDEFYHHDAPIDPDPTDLVVELELVVKEVVWEPDK